MKHTQAALAATDWMDQAVDEFPLVTDTSTTDVQSLHSEEKAA